MENPNRSVGFFGPANENRLPLIVGVGGTTREESSSERALRRTLSFAKTHGARTVAVTGSALPDSIYDPVKSERCPKAFSLIELLRSADGVIFSSPAYHGSISGFLKNALDYIEDMRDDDQPYLEGRAVGLICCAMGWQAGGATLGAMRSITHSLRGWPTPIGVLINSAATGFGADDRCLDEAIDQQLRIMAGQIVEFAFARNSARRYG
ncbi:FMN reductase [Chelativorans sp. ZYF759]|nr:FMN reductase [Chelativorans sp. ZYF759]